MRLAVAGAGARHREHLQAGCPVELLDDVTERPVLLGLEGSGGHEAHEMVVDAVR